LGALKGALLGLISGFLIAISAGAVMGGVGRAAACGYAPDFASGAIFGAFAFGVLLGAPASVIGALAGGVIGLFCDRSGTPPSDRSGTPPMRLPPMTKRQWMIVVAVVGLLLGGAAELHRLRRRQSESSDRAQWHRGFVSDWNAGWRSTPSEAKSRWIAYHAEMARKYERAAQYPWLTVKPDPPEPPSGE
jgi:hypothetical protein